MELKRWRRLKDINSKACNAINELRACQKRPTDKLLVPFTMEELYEIASLSGGEATILKREDLKNEVLTNGDVIKDKFPDVKWYVNEDNEVFTDHWTFNSNKVRLDYNWWNSPYKNNDTTTCNE